MPTRRQRLNMIRNSLDAITGDLLELATEVESRNARTLIDRVRKLVNAARTEADAALVQPLDPLAPANATPPTRAEVLAVVADIPTTVVSISPGALRLKLRRPADERVDAAIADAMTGEGWRRNSYGYYHRPQPAAAAR